MIPNALELILNNFKGSTQAVIPDSSDWIRCESELGRSIPEDYKTIINKTGAHSMGRCMLRNPALTSHFSLSRNALLREQLIFGQMAKEMLDIDFYPEIGGWIQLAYVDRPRAVHAKAHRGGHCLGEFKWMGNHRDKHDFL